MILMSILAPLAPANSACPVGEVFESPVELGAGQPSAFACAVGDMNRDGINDAAFLSVDARLRIKLGGSSLAGTGEYSFTVPEGGVGLALVDADSDGFLDVVMSAGSGLTVLRAISAGSIWSGTLGAPTTVATVPDARRLAVADFDGDGISDVVVGALGGSDIAVHRGSGAGIFGPAEFFAAGAAPFSVATADFNEDGRVDIAVATLSGTLSILLGAGTPGDLDFSPSASYPASGQLLDIAIADFNGDDRLDIGLTNSPDRVSVLLGLGAGTVGDGTFADIYHIPVGATPYGLAAADVDGDGVPDLVSGNNGSADVSLLRGVGNGSFLQVETYRVRSSGTDVSLDDVTGDGICDLIVAGNPEIISRGTCPTAPTPPIIQGFTPVGGDVGDLISLSGRGLIPPISVSIGDMTCAIVSGSVPPVVVAVPAGAVSGPITVTTAIGTFTTTDTFFVGPHPIITSLDPVAARVGQIIRVRGQHFDRVVRCSFGAHNSAPFVVNSPEEIVATVNGTAVSGNVHVFTRTGEATSPVPFTLLPPDTSASIVSVRDIANDQGGHVVVKWRRSDADVTESNLILGYRVWRRAPLQDLSSRPRTSAPFRRTADGWYWEAIGEIPAARLAGYAFTASTPQDSLGSATGWTAFFIQTMTTDPAIFYSSNVDSGYSVDNLSPPIPLPFAATYTQSSIALHWTRNLASDFREFRLHRGTVADFLPDATNLIVATRDTGHVDPMGGAFYYKLIAADVHGNLSRIAAVSPTNPVAALATAREAIWDGQVVRLRWSTSATPADPVIVQRRTEESPWRDLSTHAVDGAGELAWVDEQAQMGGRYGYRLQWNQEGEVVTSGEVWVEVRQALTRLSGIRPNPASRETGFSVNFTLRTGAPATLEVFDLSGRRVARETLPSPTPGPHELHVQASRGLAPGVYLVELRAGGDRMITRAAIVQ